MGTYTCKDNFIYMCELDYKATTDADNKRKPNNIMKTSINQSAVQSV